MKRTGFIELFLTSVIIMLFVALVNLVNFRVEFTKPIRQGLFDFDVYDLEYAGLPGNNTMRDTNIVLVQAGPDRLTIARQLLMLDSLQPKVMSVDVLFPDSSSPAVDNLFAGMLEQLQGKTVFSFRFVDDKEAVKVPFRNFFSSSSRHAEGYVDFVADTLSVVRLYAPFVTLDNKQYTAFTSQVLKAANPGKFEKLKARNNRQELIHYSGNIERYTYFRYQDLDYYQASGQLASKIKNKIVLLGYFEPTPPWVVEDLHFTPMNDRASGKSVPDTYGVVIHANILSMALEESYLAQSPVWVAYFVAFVFVFFACWLVVYLHHRFHHPLLHLGLLLLMIVAIVVVVGLFIFLFAWLHIKMPLLPVITGLVIAIELQDAFRWFAGRLISLFSKKAGNK